MTHRHFTSSYHSYHCNQKARQLGWLTASLAIFGIIAWWLDDLDSPIMLGLQAGYAVLYCWIVGNYILHKRNYIRAKNHEIMIKKRVLNDSITKAEKQRLKSNFEVHQQPIYSRPFELAIDNSELLKNLSKEYVDKLTNQNWRRILKEQHIPEQEPAAKELQTQIHGQILQHISTLMNVSNQNED